MGIPIWDNAIALLKDAMDRFIPDKTQAAQAKATLDQLRENSDAQQVLAGLDIVKAEAQGQSWLQRNWRPIVALTFASLVVAYWFGYSAPNLPPAAIDKLFSIVQICLGGYTIGRSGEKIATSIAPAIAAALKK